MSMLLPAMKVQSQPDYPVAAAVKELRVAEYFIDNDPGHGHGVSISLPAGVNVADLSIPIDLTGLREGIHRLYVRSKDESGSWSLTSSFIFNNITVPVYPETGSVSPVVAAEYFLDSDPGPGNGIPVSLPETADLQNWPVIINLASANRGIHQLYIRTRNAAGQWSLNNVFYFDNSQLAPYPSAGPVSPLSDLEYYIDNDPGYGNGTPVSVTPGTDIQDISFQVPLNSLMQGVHTIHVRSRSNPWSLNAYVTFNYGTPLPLTWLYVRGEMRTEGARIDWATASESRTDSFYIEHSTDGRAFRAVGSLPAAGNSQQTRYYQFIHSQPDPGMNYYRIRQTDEDDRFTYSHVISLMHLSSLKKASIAPNPVRDMLYVALPDGKRATQLEIYDRRGTLLLRKQEAGSSTLLRVPAEQLSSGWYVLKVLYDGGGLESLKFVKE